MKRFRANCGMKCVTTLLKYKVIGHLFQENIGVWLGTITGTQCICIMSEILSYQYVTGYNHR